MKIVVDRRWNDYRARLAGTKLWDRGRTASEAIGRLALLIEAESDCLELERVG